jgi:hypothetical protein
MLIQFTLQDLMIFLVCAVGILAGAIMLPILWNIKKVVGIVRPLIENNQDSLRKSIKAMPVIIGDMEQIGGNLRDTTDKLRISLPVIIQEVEHVANSAKGSLSMAGDVMQKMGSGINETVTAYKKDSTGYFHLFEELMQLIYRSLTSGK